MVHCVEWQIGSYSNAADNFKVEESTVESAQNSFNMVRRNCTLRTQNFQLFFGAEF